MDNDSKQKADEEWRKNWEHLDSEGLARKFLEFLEDDAKTALKFDNLTEDNRKTIEDGLERLRPAFEKLAAIINKTAGTGYGGHGWGDLHRLMAWTWALGAKGDVPESAPQAQWVQEKVVQLKNLGYSRLPRTAKYSEEKEALKKILIDNPTIDMEEAAEKSFMAPRPPHGAARWRS